MYFSFSSANVDPEHHVKILEALIMVGGLVEIQAAPGRTTEVFIIFQSSMRLSSWMIYYLCTIAFLYSIHLFFHWR